MSIYPSQDHSVFIMVQKKDETYLVCDMSSAFVLEIAKIEWKLKKLHIETSFFSQESDNTRNLLVYLKKEEAYLVCDKSSA